MGESVSPGPDSSQDDIRQWAVAVFKQHETILKDVFTRLAGDNLVLTQRMDTLERANMDAAQVVHTVVANVEAAHHASTSADSALRQELSAFADKLKINEEYSQTVHHNFGGHVTGAFQMLEVKLQQLEASLNTATSSASGTAAATLPEGMANVNAAQAYEIKCMGLALQGLAVEQARAGTVLSSLENKCHCPHVAKLMEQIHAAEISVGQLFQRTQATEDVLKGLSASKPSGDLPHRSPGFVPGAYSFGTGTGGGGDRGEPYTTKFMANKSYRSIGDLDKLFDDKAATSSAHAYAGDVNEGVKWRRTVRGYFISRNRVLAPILDFVESFELREVTMESMEAQCIAEGWMIDDLDRLGEVLWGFLNTCLRGTAKETFELADDLDGFNAWRRVVQDIRKSRNIRLAQTRRAVRNPPSVKDVGHIAQAVKNFDAIHKAYREAGGTIHDAQEKKLDLLESMPKEIRSQLQWRMKLPEGYEEFRDMLVSTADDINYHDGLGGRGSGGLHALERDEPSAGQSHTCAP